MEERPFYELDDEELLIEEATSAALSVRETASVGDIAPRGLVLHTPNGGTRAAQLRTIIQERSGSERAHPSLTLIDHALIVNALTCTHSRSGDDVFGLATLLRNERTMLMLDRTHPQDHARSDRLEGIHEVFTRIGSLTPQHPEIEQRSTEWSRDRSETFLTLPVARQLARGLTEDTPFFALRRLTLELMPTSTIPEEMTDTLREYIMHVRLILNTASAQSLIQSWKYVTALQSTEASALGIRVLMNTV